MLSNASRITSRATDRLITPDSCDQSNATNAAATMSPHATEGARRNERAVKAAMPPMLPIRSSR